jgi:type II secretory pathway component PulF
MATYIYKAKKSPTEIISGQIEADSQDRAVDKLTEAGLVPISVEPKLASGPAENVQEVSSQNKSTLNPYSKLSVPIRIKAQDIDIFTRQLASLIKAGVPMLRALTLISGQTENKALKQVAGSLEKQVRDGKMLSGAIGGYPGIFNSLYLNMVKAGEKIGAVDEILYNLAEYRQKEQEIRQKIAAALAYPLLMIVVGIATIFIMLTFFLPKFVGLYESLKEALPLSTRVLIGVSGFMSANWYWFLIGLVFIFAVFGRAKEGSKKKFWFDLLKLRLPFLNKFIKHAEVAKFTRTLSLLLKNGISVCEALELATEVLDNDALKKRLVQTRLEIINQGCTLSQSLKNVEVFPVFAVNMISVGEEGGKLVSSLKDISDLYEREVEQAVKIATTLLEPILILIVGGIVGFIVFAMLMPIFNIGMVVR